MFAQAVDAAACNSAGVPGSPGGGCAPVGLEELHAEMSMDAIGRSAAGNQHRNREGLTMRCLSLVTAARERVHAGPTLTVMQCDMRLPRHDRQAGVQRDGPFERWWELRPRDRLRSDGSAVAAWRTRPPIAPSASASAAACSCTSSSAAERSRSGSTPCSRRSGPLPRPPGRGRRGAAHRARRPLAAKRSPGSAAAATLRQM